MTYAYGAVYWLFAMLVTFGFRRSMRTPSGKDPLARDVAAVLVGASWPISFPFLLLLAVAYFARPEADRR